MVILIELNENNFNYFLLSEFPGFDHLSCGNFNIQPFDETIFPYPTYAYSFIAAFTATLTSVLICYEITPVCDGIKFFLMDIPVASVCMSSISRLIDLRVWVRRFTLRAYKIYTGIHSTFGFGTIGSRKFRVIAGYKIVPQVITD
jgi:hypothetical protein